MQTWGTSYSRDGDFVVFYDTKWWVEPVEATAFPFTWFGFTYGIANAICNLADRGRSERHREPLPPTLERAWWKEDEPLA